MPSVLEILVVVFLLAIGALLILVVANAVVMILAIVGIELFHLHYKFKQYRSRRVNSE